MGTSASPVAVRSHWVSSEAGWTGCELWLLVKPHYGPAARFPFHVSAGFLVGTFTHRFCFALGADVAVADAFLEGFHIAQLLSVGVRGSMSILAAVVAHL